jgi:hypothetical protein
MIEIVIFGVFFGLLVVGSLIADARGRLPSVDELADQDQAHWNQLRRSA